MGEYLNKNNTLLKIRGEEGIQEALFPIIILPEPEKTDPRYDGLEEVYFQDTEGMLAGIPRKYQIRTVEEFIPFSTITPWCLGRGQIPISALGIKYQNLVDSGVYKNDPNINSHHDHDTL